VGNLIREELAEMVRRELDDPRLDAVSFTGVEVTEDFRYARVHVSYFGPEAERGDVLEVLGRAAPYLRSLLGRRIRLRRTPELSFAYDASVDRGLRIQALLAEIAEEDPGETGAADAGTDEEEEDAGDSR
jgi:ribosome-binding factor A